MALLIPPRALHPPTRPLQQDTSALLGRRSIDNSALSRLAGGGSDNYLAAAAAALASGNAVGSLGGGGGSVSGSLPSQSYMSAAAALQSVGLGRSTSGIPGAGQSPNVLEEDRTLSLEQ